MPVAELNGHEDARVVALLHALEIYRGRARGVGAGRGGRGEEDGERPGEAFVEVAVRFVGLVERLGIEAVDARLLGALLAAEVYPEVSELAAGDWTHAGAPWLSLGRVAELLGGGATVVIELSRRLDERLPLLGYALVEREAGRSDAPLAGRRLKLDGEVVDYLVRGAAAGAEAGTGEAPVFADEDAWGAARARVADAAARGQPVLVEIAGPAGTGRARIADDLGRAAGRSGVVTRRLRHDAGGVEVARVLAALQRDARLGGAAACLVLDDGTGEAGRRGDDGVEQAPAAPRDDEALRALLGARRESLTLIAPRGLARLDEAGLAVVRVATHFPRPAERARCLEAAIRAAGAAAAPGVDLWQVGRRYALDGKQLVTAVRAAVEACAARAGAGEVPALQFDDLQASCRRQIRDELFDLATRVTAHHEWGDMVVEGDVVTAMREMTDTVREARRVYEQWGFARRHSLSQGVTALFAGPPGTGKTMCAAVMARELDMELLRVDLSRVVSKWIGETEKNLGRIFDAAERAHAILLFDEADSLFASRTDVKSSVDRYANLEVNYLLQRMEAFSGLTILTSNYEDTIDPAFKRRIHFKLRFEKPDADGRTLLWQKAFPDTAPLAGDFDARALAERFEMSGASIRNAAVRAGFLAAAAEPPDSGVAARITQAHCHEAAEREAREMGILTRRALHAGDDDPPDPDSSPASPTPNAPGRSAPRLVPVTHPRR